MDYVCDTNVWYDIADGRLDPAKLKKGGNRLLSPAINALEISSNIDTRTFRDRQQASQAILDHADDYLDDPERHMGSIWSLKIPPLGFDWKDVLRTIAASKDIAEMEDGPQNIMKVNSAGAKSWRKGFTDRFVSDVEAVIRVFVPKYALRRAHGKMGYLKDGPTIKLLHDLLHSTIVTESQVLLTRTRASDHLDDTPTDASQTEIDAATTQLLRFCQSVRDVP